MENKTISDEPLYVMTIELDEGKSSNVKIFLDSKPEELAFDFCKENNLDYSSMSYLSNQIKTLMEKFTNEITKENNECIEELEEENTNTKRKQKKKKDRKEFKNINANTLKKDTHTLFSCEKFFNRIKENNVSKSKNKSRLYSNNVMLTTNNSTNNTSVNNTSKKIKRNKSFDIFYRKKEPQKENKVNGLVTEEEKEKLLKSLLPEKNKTKHIQRNTYTNVGERIYEKGVKLSEMEKIKIKKLKDNLTKSQKEVYTFKPIINKNTNIILKRSKSKKSFITNSDNILNYKSVVEKRIQHLKEKYNKDTDYDFKPKFNKHSLNIENKKKIPFKERIEQLYSSSKHKNKKIKQMEDQIYDISFTPQFTDYPNGSLNNKSFEERQSIYHSRSQEKMNKLILEVNEPNDKVTGQELFHPYLYTSNSSVSLKRNSNVFNTLYSYMNKYKRNRSQNLESFTITDIERRNVKVNQTSSKIFYNKKKETFTKIFNLLDRDSDDSITILNMDLNKLPPTIITIIQPIITEMKNKENTALSKRNFIDACMELFDSLPYNDKQTLLNFNGHFLNKSFESNFTFHPQIDKNSEKICNGVMYFSSLTDNGKVSDCSYTKYLKHNSTGENSVI